MAAVSVAEDFLLDLVFGPDAEGATAEERARASKRQFVRSQSQLALMTDRAKGIPITASAALELVGFEGLLRVVNSGATVINSSLDEPSRTIRAQRAELNVSEQDVARASGLSVAEVVISEELGTVLPIRKLLRLGQTLGLDDDTLGAVPSAGADRELAYRLRTMQASKTVQLSASLVLKLSEAAWVISKQHKLARMLNPNCRPPGFHASTDYSKPAWKRGWELAEHARNLLDVDPVAPIASVRALIEGMNIPLIQAELGQTFAGATIQNGEDRGIVVNVDGDNNNVWVRRATLCHELGHLLWDPAERLQRLHVDRYEDLRTEAATAIEARANAFSIAFLAPPQAVIEIVRNEQSPKNQVARLMEEFGLAATAAKFHLANVAREWGSEIDTTNVRADLLPSPDDEWMANENRTIDFFPIKDVPMNRAGRFAGLVAAAARRKCISLDYAATCLGVDRADLEGKLDLVIELTAADLS